MTMDADNERQEALGPPVQRPVVRLEPERAVACPFCGRSDLLGVEPYPEGGFLSVRCRACGCIGPAKRSESDGDAWAAWNDRKTHNDQLEPLPQAVGSRRQFGL